MSEEFEPNDFSQNKRYAWSTVLRRISHETGVDVPQLRLVFRFFAQIVMEQTALGKTIRLPDLGYFFLRNIRIHHGRFGHVGDKKTYLAFRHSKKRNKRGN